MKYFTFKDGAYIEDVEGYLVGIDGHDSYNNSIRLIIHTPDQVGLQNANTGYVYGKYIKPEGIVDYLFDSNIRVNVNDSNYVDVKTGLTVPSSEALNEDGTIRHGYSKQLKFFVDASKGEIKLPAPLYEIWMKQVIQDEADFLENVNYRL